MYIKLYGDNYLPCHNGAQQSIPQVCGKNFGVGNFGLTDEWCLIHQIFPHQYLSTQQTK